MSKVRLGMTAGAVLGLFDGLTAIFSPAVHSILLTIIVASTLKGLATGVAAGSVATKTTSVSRSVLAGLTVGLVLSATAAALVPDPQGNHYYVAIALPGMALGIIVGSAAQRFGSPAPAKTITLGGPIA